MLIETYHAEIYRSGERSAMIAKALKTMEKAAVEEAAKAMAHTLPFLIINRVRMVCLVPVPDHKGCLLANEILAKRIAADLQHFSLSDADIVVRKAVIREVPLPEPSKELRKYYDLSISDHVMRRQQNQELTGQIILVDNVSTTGLTLKACASVLPDCRAVVYAESVRVS